MAKKKKDVDCEGLVGTSGGLTINLGGFQTARIDCWATIPCKADQAKDKYEKCKAFVGEKLAKDAEKIFSEYQDINGSVST